MDAGAARVPEDNGAQRAAGAGGQHPVPVVRAAAAGDTPHRARQGLGLPQAGELKRQQKKFFSSAELLTSSVY